MAVDNRKRIDPAVRAETRHALVARLTLVAVALGAVLVAAGAGWAGWRYLTHGDAMRIASLRSFASTR